MEHIRKIFAVLRPEQRRHAYWLFALMLVAMVLETLGVGLIIPFLALVSEPDIGSRYPLLKPYLDRLGNPDQKTLIMLGMLGMLGFFAVKNAFLAFMVWQRSAFVADTQAGLARRLFRAYLLQPYTFHLMRNSAQLIRNVSVESNQFTAGLNSLIELVTQGLVLIGIGALLLVVEPIGGLVALLILGIAGTLLQYVTKQRIRRWGKARRFHQGRIIQHLQQGLGGVKDIKLLGHEESFLAQFATHAVGNAQAERKRKFLNGLPRLWFEFLAVLGLVALVVSMLAQGRAIESIIPTLAVFAAAAFRLMPKLGQVTTSSQELRFVGPVIDSVHAELRDLERVSPEPRIGLLPFGGEIRLECVGFTYDGANVAAIIDVDLAIPIGASVGFIGGSGAGKSTLIDVILGLIRPSSGRVLVDGVDIETNLRGWQDQIGYVPQSIFLTDDTLRRNIAFGIADKDIDEVAVLAAVKSAQLEDLLASLPDGLETLVGERGVRLSGGQRQRIGIARALYHDPAVLVLDEATSALDTATEQGVMDAVDALHGNKTIIIVAHRLTTVAHCDKLYRLDRGRLVSEGAYAEVVNA
ncbi:ABC transporter ATP-binding protein [Thiocapsa roseopersicina]|uniref:ABC-type multidrug transport system, ATPase and permease component n=1 Tax=Thiocapsa roseopersicina TaxID=1058 RepID=A0A1H2Y4J8_THIRO|nr:ABC transporter ATP-binding protein [Thiocapsa roseopersicina]SDX00112.1 ABC-type multidrug transport system, ATPase and permease component [Thiocapsa roseopersicina]